MRDEMGIHEAIMSAHELKLESRNDTPQVVGTKSTKTRPASNRRTSAHRVADDEPQTISLFPNLFNAHTIPPTTTDSTMGTTWSLFFANFSGIRLGAVLRKLENGTQGIGNLLTSNHHGQDGGTIGKQKHIIPLERRNFRGLETALAAKSATHPHRYQGDSWDPGCRSRPNAIFDSAIA